MKIRIHPSNPPNLIVLSHFDNDKEFQSILNKINKSIGAPFKDQIKIATTGDEFVKADCPLPQIEMSWIKPDLQKSYVLECILSTITEKNLSSVLQDAPTEYAKIAKLIIAGTQNDIKFNPIKDDKFTPIFMETVKQSICPKKFDVAAFLTNFPVSKQQTIQILKYDNADLKRRLTREKEKKHALMLFGEVKKADSAMQMEIDNGECYLHPKSHDKQGP